MLRILGEERNRSIEHRLARTDLSVDKYVIMAIRETLLAYRRA
jgi:hypothetical protein